MAIRKYLLAAVFIALLAISYFYLINKYNSKTVEFDFSGQISRSDLENLRKSTKTLVNKGTGTKELACIVNYTGRYGGSKLIMTSGLDNLANNINMQRGRWIANGETKEAVIGDRAADKLFRSSSVVGQILKLRGQEYKIVGVIKNSKEIYISFEESNRLNWDKKSIKFIVPDNKRLQLYVELLEGKLKGLGLDIVDVSVYKQEAYRYINIILVIALLILFDRFKKLWKDIDKSARSIYLSYKEQIRAIELYKYVYKYRKDIIAVLLKLLAASLLLFAVLKCIALLQISPGWIPNNLFSPTSYIEVIKVNLLSYISRLENGVSGILLEIHMINLLLILYIGIAIIIKRNWDAKKL